MPRRAGRVHENEKCVKKHKIQTAAGIDIWGRLGYAFTRAFTDEAPPTRRQACVPERCAGDPAYIGRRERMKLIYNVSDKVPLKKNLIFALQQLLAIIAATILVPTLVNAGAGEKILDQSAALFGAGVATLFYHLVTRRKSPVFLGSSFAFISPLISAVAFGYLGIFLGAVFAGLVYVVVSLLIKASGTKWVNNLLPPVVIGPTVALIGLSLCSSAVGNMSTDLRGNYNLISILCALITFCACVYASLKGMRTLSMIPFIVGIAVGYAAASIFTLIGSLTGVEYLKIVDYSALVNNFTPLTFSSFFDVPDFTFLGFFREGQPRLSLADVGQIAIIFAPVAFVTLAEHIADHKNLSSIIEKDLITDPGLDRTLIGDGVGTMIGSLFGGCPNTTYGESIGCVAISGNASVSTISITCIFAMVLAFFRPFVALVNTIPTCVVGGICIALYGFIAVSGLKMLKDVDLGKNSNLFVVAAILVTGIGGLTLNFGKLTFSSIATALILGVIVNLHVHGGKRGERKVI